MGDHSATEETLWQPCPPGTHLVLLMYLSPSPKGHRAITYPTVPDVADVTLENAMGGVPSQIATSAVREATIGENAPS